MNIKDFIIKGDIPPKEEKTINRSGGGTEYTFTIAYENDTDFILQRKTQKTDKMLVVLVSQGQIYIKDNVKNTIENVVHEDQVKKFRTGLTHKPAFEKLTWTPFREDCRGYSWDRTYYTYTSDAFDKLIHHKNAFKVLANKKMNPFDNFSLVRQYEADPENFGKVTEVVKMMNIIDPDFSTRSDGYDTIKRNLVEAKIDYNIIKANKDIIEELGVSNFKVLLRQTQFYSAIKDYGCDFKTLLKYLLYTIKYRNGLSIGAYGEFQINQYIDYLRMQQEMYGKIKEKYPLYWLSEKQMMINKYNKWRELKQVMAFSLEQEKMKKYEFEDDVYKVIVPMESSDIIDEANQQQHCVASYIDRIRQGKTHILFIRQRLNEEESCLTVEVTPDARIVQVRGFQNRDYTALEYSFMKKWAEEKELILEVREVV